MGLLPAFAQTVPAPAKETGTPKDPLKRESPQSTVLAFLDACRAHDYQRAVDYLDLRKLPQSERVKSGIGVAQQLEQILNRDTQFDVASLSADPEGDRADGLPANRERVASFSENGQTLDLELERTNLRSKVSIWRFSSDTVDRIPQIARMTSTSPVEKHLPDPLVNWKLADTALWQWIALLLLALALTIASSWVCRSAISCSVPLLRRFSPKTDPAALQMFIGPLRILVSVALFRAGMAWIAPSVRLKVYLDRGLALFFFLGMFLLCAAIVDIVLRRLRVVLQVRHQSFSYSVLPLAGRVLKITLFLLTIAAVLSEWGYNTTTILAGLGVGGIAIALAAQKTIENFFGGVSVISDRPVAVGDFCKFGDRSGTVEDIGLRSTRIRTPDRTLVSVPNGQFSTMTLENFSLRDKTLFHFTLNLRRDTKPDHVRALLDSITRILKDQKKVEPGNLPVRFIGVGTYSLDLEISVYVLTPDGDEFMKIQQDLLLRILDAVEEAGTALAIPTQASVEYSVHRDAKTNGNGAPAEIAKRQ